MDSWELNSNEESNEDFFAARLAALRENHQVSARKMSLALDQNSSYINRIENKKRFLPCRCFSRSVIIWTLPQVLFLNGGGKRV